MEQPDLLQKIVEVFEELDITYAVVGSVVSSSYGQGRHTQDVDILINLPYGKVQPFCDKFPSPDYYVNPESAIQAIQSGGQFNIIESSTGDKADLMIPKYGTWQEQQLSYRRKRQLLPNRDVFVARPEDIILSKMEYYKEGGSEKHLRDITGMLKISPEEIDKDYVETWAEKLDVMDVWKAILRRLDKNE